MNKKLLIYGLAFGSASAALSYIYLTSAVYKSPGWVQAVAVLSEGLIIPGIGMFLFLKAYKNDAGEQFTMGRAIFLSFFLSVIMAATVSLMYSYIYQFKPEFIAQIKDFRTNLIRNSKALNDLKGKGEYEKAVADNIAALEANLSMRGQFVSQLFLGGSRGLFLGAIMAYIMRPKTTRKA